MFGAKSEMEDLSFAVVDPDSFREIMKARVDAWADGKPLAGRRRRSLKRRRKAAAAADRLGSSDEAQEASAAGDDDTSAAAAAASAAAAAALAASIAPPPLRFASTWTWDYRAATHWFEGVLRGGRPKEPPVDHPEVTAWRVRAAAEATVREEVGATKLTLTLASRPPQRISDPRFLS